MKKCHEKGCKLLFVGLIEFSRKAILPRGLIVLERLDRSRLLQAIWGHPGLAYVLP